MTLSASNGHHIECQDLMYKSVGNTRIQSIAICQSAKVIMLTHHWEQYDLTCNGKEVTETQTDGKVAFERKPQAAHEVQDRGLQFDSDSFYNS